jgi:hypothetical protein
MLITTAEISGICAVFLNYWRRKVNYKPEKKGAQGENITKEDYNRT